MAHVADENIICAILSLEGMHGLGVYKVKHLFSKKSIEDVNLVERSIIKQTFVDHISQIKSNPRTTPFYITFAHHYNNLLCGHAMSFGGVLKLFFKQKGGLNKGLSEFGKLLIERHLLSRHNGKRILIDIKHMSVKSRRSYYEITEKMRNEDDPVPIISSHSAVSSVATLSEAERQKSSKKLDKYSYVSRWDINLTNEDIIKIYKSNGLIGILMHDGRMPGNVFKQRFKKARTPREEKMLHVQMFLTNIYHLVHVVYKELDDNAWNLMTLGSDMDGVIDPFDNYNTAASLSDFKRDIQNYLQIYNEIPEGFKIVDLYAANDIISEETFIRLNQGNSIQEIVDKIFYKNMETFLSKYFTEQYLNN
jgi:microsomal dipeptidase-like Zn-dependent dipeptidase